LAVRPAFDGRRLNVEKRILCDRRRAICKTNRDRMQKAFVVLQQAKLGGNIELDVRDHRLHEVQLGGIVVWEAAMVLAVKNRLLTYEVVRMSWYTKKDENECEMRPMQYGVACDVREAFHSW
jgi:hypothetical protein